MDFVDEPKKLTVSLNNKPDELAPKKTYFYELPSGRVEPAEAVEAWRHHKNGYKQVGVSDGKTYLQAVREAQQLFKEQGLEAAQERLRKGFSEELEVARGHFETPPNADAMGPGVQYMNKVRF